MIIASLINFSEKRCVDLMKGLGVNVNYTSFVTSDLLFSNFPKIMNKNYDTYCIFFPHFFPSEILVVLSYGTTLKQYICIQANSEDPAQPLLKKKTHFLMKVTTVCYSHPK